WRERQDRLAQRAGVKRQLDADLEHAEGGVGAEHVMDHDDARAVHHAHAHSRPGPARKMVRMRDRAGAQLVEVKVRVPELEQARTELVLVRIAVLLDEAVRLKGLEQAVDSGPGEAETFRELADAEPA